VLSLFVAISLGIAPKVLSQSWTLTTLAGSTTGGGYADGTGLEARFSSPHSVAIDASGNVFVADRGNHIIRKITASGSVTTFAGLAGVVGSADGTGSSARFYYPSGLAIDLTNGVLYVADSWNHTIRKITPSGVVTTLAGTTGKFGDVDANGAAAKFTYPQGLAVDQSGFVWVADTSNHKIRRIVGAAATVTTFAGNGFAGSSDGTGTSASFNFPFDVAVDANGDLWVADSSNNEIRKVTREGVVTTVAGVSFESGSADGSGTDARFDRPWGLEVAPNGDVWVADSRNNKIRKVTVTGVVSTIAGSGSYGTRDGVATQARFAFPTGLGFDRNGIAYVADRESQAVRKIPTSSLTVTTSAGSAPSSGTVDGLGLEARLFFPGHAIADTTGNVYFVDSAHTIRKFTPDGVVTTIAGLAGTPGSADGTGVTARFNYPSGITLDTTGNLWVADTFNHTIRKITPSGVVTTVAGAVGVAGKADGIGSQARFNYPWGLAFDNTGNLIIADTYNHLVRVMDPSGIVTAYAGSGTKGSLDSSAHNASFNFPIAVAADAARNVYVVDYGNSAIRKITASGTVLTLAGNAATSGAEDGSGSSAHFSAPYALALDANGNIFVADSGNHEIRKVTPSGAVTTIVGRSGSPGNVDGTGGAARLFFPEGIAVDARGRVVVVDTYNHGLRVAAIALPTIQAFLANPETVKAGTSTTLTWATTDASSVTITPSVGSVAANGSVVVVPTQTTVYTLTATNAGGTVIARVTVLTPSSRRHAVGH
jgi:sugar lactone lactonase YvrE